MTENKRFNLWDMEGTTFIEDHKEGSYHIGKTEDVNLNSLRNITKRLNIYAEENKQLKKRNENQYNQLNELWKLIEAKDWETLTAMDNQMKEDEERLQQEWKCYE